MKMLTTQLAGLLQRIATSQEEAIEETARLVAQAAVGEGKIYFAAFGEMDAVYANAQASGLFPRLARWTPDTEVTSADRVLILTPSAASEKALQLAKQLSDAFIPFSVIAPEKQTEDNELAELAYTYVSLGFTKGLLPTDTGERIVLPYAFAALFVYEAILMAVREMTDEDEEEL
ncbi:hypothetical protein CQS04_06630 [Chryseomicrobium excrementi]|uniref:DUF2529 domain-containing protein n=1 Tax=Chryseomicrobium excrementi TaxID=2041346 RepID=A0A2M9F045_9BACL|nr:DUF2529 family protein [Chryseomicrobium excrementi]PJK16823.1 hypothetical protein CQS04_06630 [Chryseomicrobium excrementi]